MKINGDNKYKYFGLFFLCKIKMTQEEEDVSFHIYIKRVAQSGKKQKKFDFTLASSFVDDLNRMSNQLIRHITKLAIYICRQRGKKIVQCKDIETAHNILTKHPNNFIKNRIKDENTMENFYERALEFLKNKINKTFENLDSFTGKKKRRTSNMEKTKLKFSTTRVKKVMEQVKSKDIKYSLESILCLTVIVQTEIGTFIVDSIRLNNILNELEQTSKVRKFSLEKLATTKISKIKKDTIIPNVSLCRFI